MAYVSVIFQLDCNSLNIFQLLVTYQIFFRLACNASVNFQDGLWYVSYLSGWFIIYISGWFVIHQLFFRLVLWCVNYPSGWLVIYQISFRLLVIYQLSFRLACNVTVIFQAACNVSTIFQSDLYLKSMKSLDNLVCLSYHLSGKQQISYPTVFACIYQTIAT